MKSVTDYNTLKCILLVYIFNNRTNCLDLIHNEFDSLSV